MNLTLRSSKGSALTHAEFDGNFQYLAGLMTPAAPERIDESGSDYFYFGFSSADGWTIRRQNRATGALEFASGTNDFNTAWDNRAGLTYSA